MLDLLKFSDDVDDARSRIDIAGSKLGAINLTCPPLDQLHADTWPSQRQLTEIAYRPVLADLIDSASKTSRPLEAWIRSCCCFGAYNWLMAIPGIAYFECSSSVYAMMLRQWLGMPVVNVSLHETPVCAAKGCKETFGGAMLSGSHWDSVCCGATVFRNQRHDAVRDVFYRAYLELGISVQREPRGLYQGSNSRPADVLVPPAKPSECDRALDFVIVNPRSNHALDDCPGKGALIASALAGQSTVEDHEKMVIKYGVSSAC